MFTLKVLEGSKIIVKGKKSISHSKCFAFNIVYLETDIVVYEEVATVTLVPGVNLTCRLPYRLHHLIGNCFVCLSQQSVHKGTGENLG